MKAFTALVLLAGLATASWSQETGTAPARTARAPDLDFTEDFPNPDLPRNPPSAIPPAPPPPAPAAPTRAASVTPRTWMYWAAGFTALAGGLAWYAHWESDQPPDPVRTDEVFSDDPD